MDRFLLFTARGLRSFGFGFSAVLIGLLLEHRGLSPFLIGLALGIGLAAASLSGLASAWAAARWGRRPVLAAAGILMALTGLDIALASQPLLLVLAGLTGMLGAASVDLGPFASVEQAVLAETAPAARRNIAFGRYSLTGGLLNAAGGLSATLATTPAAATCFFLLYAAIGAATAGLPLLMSRGVEHEAGAPAFGRLGPLAGLAALFALDSLGGGFVVNAVIAYWLHARFGVGASLLGPVFAAVAVLQSLSYEVSARLANRIGLINTMVFTHIPSSLLLVTVAFAPTFPIAAALFLLREGLVEMDVPTRQSYVMAVVAPEERTFASGVTHLVRMGAWAVAPSFAGLLMQGVSMAVPLVIGATLKIGYDIALYAAFRRVRPPEEA